MSKEKLAISGGAPVITTVFPGRFQAGREELEICRTLWERAIDSGEMFGYQGREEEAFGREFSEWLGNGYADGVNSGTNSVYVALRSLDLEPFSEVIVGCVTDPGGMMPIVLNNCIPVVADSMPGAYNTGAPMIEPLITEFTRAIVVAHIGGEPVDMIAVMALAQKYNLPVIEDCSQSHGAKINGRNVGTFGEVGCFSLMFGKHMCVGGQGGAVFTHSLKRYWQLRRAADRGKPFDLPAGSTHVMAALNCNMDELHAAIGRVQLRKLSGVITRRQRFAAMLLERGLGKLESILVPELPPGFEHCYWWWRLGVKHDAIKCSKTEWVAALQAEGVSLNPSYHAALPATFTWFKNRAEHFPWNAPQYRGNPQVEYPCPNAMQAMDTFFNLNIHESWGESEADQIYAAFVKVNTALMRG